jgi:hypothetical protein
MNALLRSLTLLLFLVVTALVSFGQGITGSITGTVTDSSGAPIAGATVAIRQVGTDATRTILTSDVGSYRITQLAPGASTVGEARTLEFANEVQLLNRGLPCRVSLRGRPLITKAASTQIAGLGCRRM